MTNYNDPIIFNWHIDKDTGEKYSVKVDNETQTIINNKIFLNQIPDKLHSVTITGMTERLVIENENDFKVDYTNGNVTFHSSKNNTQVTVTYYGRGVVMYPASRIWTQLGNMGQVIETLREALDSLGHINDLRLEIADTLATLEQVVGSGNFSENVKTATAVQKRLNELLPQANTAYTNINTAIGKANTLKGNLDSSISLGNTTKTNLDNAISSANTSRSQLQTVINSVATVQSDLQKVIDNATSTKNSLNTLNEDAKATLANLQNKQPQINELETLVSNAETLRTDLSTLNARIEVAKTTITDIESKTTTAKNTITELVTETGKAETTLNNLKSATTLAETTKSNLDTTIVSANDVKAILEEVVERGDLNQYATTTILENHLATKQDKINIVNTLDQTSNEGIWIVMEE